MTPERRAEMIGDILEREARADLAAIRAALRGVLPRVVCPTCKGSDRLHNQLGEMKITTACVKCLNGTIDPVDGPETTLGLVERIFRHMVTCDDCGKKTPIRYAGLCTEALTGWCYECRIKDLYAEQREITAERDRIAGEVRERAAMIAGGFGIRLGASRIAAAIRAMPLQGDFVGG